MMKLFLLEDDYLLNKAISQYFNARGMDVASYYNGLDALEAIHGDYAIMILDIDTPDIDGISVMEEVRRLYPNKPIIIISATVHIEMLTKAYQKGCNDYLKKPFDIVELELKIQALLPKNETQLHLMENLEYRIGEQQLFWHGEEVILTPKEQKLFHILIENRGKVVSTEHLELAIWGIEGDTIHLRQLVARLRKKLPENVIQNRTGSGYCIV